MSEVKPCELCEKLMLIIEKLSAVFSESIQLLQEEKQHDIQVRKESEDAK